MRFTEVHCELAFSKYTEKIKTERRFSSPAPDAAACYDGGLF